jgi:hypothetical protein
MDHSIRPTCIREGGPRQISSLKPVDRLYPNNLNQSLTYHTHFCCTGLGHRVLTESELAHAFGFPVLSQAGGVLLSDFDYFLPAHLFHAVLDSSSLSRLGTVSTKAPQTLNSRLLLYKFPCQTRSWISSVGKWLNHDWIDTSTVTSKAAKRDDAVIQTALWDQRLILLYPKCLIKHLDVLRTWLLCYGR